MFLFWWRMGTGGVGDVRSQVISYLTISAHPLPPLVSRPGNSGSGSGNLNVFTKKILQNKALYWVRKALVFAEMFLMLGN